jgi:hypothetical protein
LVQGRLSIGSKRIELQFTVFFGMMAALAFWFYLDRTFLHLSGSSEIASNLVVILTSTATLVIGLKLGIQLFRSRKKNGSEDGAASA